jgi:hypothetical protein
MEISILHLISLELMVLYDTIMVLPLEVAAKKNEGDFDKFSCTNLLKCKGNKIDLSSMQEFNQRGEMKMGGWVALFCL